jgi:integrase
VSILWARDRACQERNSIDFNAFSLEEQVREYDPASASFLLSPYSPSCREGKFPETRLPERGAPGNWVLAYGVLGKWASGDADPRKLSRPGLPDIRFHDLRHTCATLLLSRGHHPKLVQELLGHASVAMTLDRYSHVLPGMGDQTAAAMEAALS